MPRFLNNPHLEYQNLTENAKQNILKYRKNYKYFSFYFV